MSFYTRLYVSTVVIIIVLWLSLSTVHSVDYKPKEYYHHPAYNYSLKFYKQCQWLRSYHGNAIAISIDGSHFIRNNQRCRVILPEELRLAL